MIFSLHQQVLDTIPDGVTIQDRDFNIIYQNAAMRQAFGDQIGSKCYTAYEQRVQICEGCGVNKVFETGMPTLVHRTAITRDNVVSHWENSCFPLFDEEGRIVAGVELCRNVTDRVSLSEEVRERSIELGKLNDQLNRKTGELEKAYQDLKIAHARMLQQEKMASIGQLAAGVAHEINNPLAFIISNLGTLGKYSKEVAAFLLAQAETLQNGASALSDAGKGLLAQYNMLRETADIDFILDDIDQIVAESLDGGERMKQIVANLKSFARLDEEKYQLADLNQGLESTLNIVWNELKYKATVNKSYGDIPETLCNSGQMNQVFMNLLVNAAQAIDGQGQIEIATRRQGDAILIEIADNGHGIPADHLNRIFEPFFTTKDVGKGTGLGLSIVYDIVGKHGGDIKVQSQPGQGTRFTLSLPIQAPNGPVED
ncbi:MAG: ATP-binding protein [Desulfosarcinaceae bacterium]